MNPILEKLNADAAAKKAQRDGLLAKGAEMTAEDVKSANGINAEIKSIIGQIGEITGLEEETKKLNEFFTTPNVTLNSGAQNQNGQVTVLGTQNAGHAEI